MTNKKMKYASIASIGLIALSLTACANDTQQYQTLGDSGLKTVEQSNHKDQCKEPELQKDGSYKCEELIAGGGGTSSSGATNSSTSIIPFWLFNGQRYDTHSAMVASNDYKNNNLVNGTKYTNPKTDGTKNNSNSKSNNSKGSTKGSSTSKSGGFGSGGRGASGGS